METLLLFHRDEFLSRALFAPMVFVVFFCFSCLQKKKTKQVREAKRFLDQGWERLGSVNQMDEAGHGDLDLRQRRVCSCLLSAS